MNLCGVRDCSDTFDEPMEYPQGANIVSGACKPTSGVGSVPAFGSASPNGDICFQDPATHRCAAPSSPLYGGFGLVSDTIGDFNGAPAIGPGEARNIQLVAKIIF